MSWFLSIFEGDFSNLSFLKVYQNIHTLDNFTFLYKQAEIQHIASKFVLQKSYILPFPNPIYTIFESYVLNLKSQSLRIKHDCEITTNICKLYQFAVYNTNT